MSKFEIESGYNCKKDSIEIRMGDDEYAPLIMKECGYEKPEPKTLLGSSVWIKFKSDGSWQEPGFFLRITKLEHSAGKIYL